MTSSLSDQTSFFIKRKFNTVIIKFSCSCSNLLASARPAVSLLHLMGVVTSSTYKQCLVDKLLQLPGNIQVICWSSSRLHALSCTASWGTHNCLTALSLSLSLSLSLTLPPLSYASRQIRRTQSTIASHFNTK